MTGRPDIEITVDGSAVAVPDDGATLLDTLRGLGHVSVKDGCSPQGQCGCCTVLVDGQPRVSCVTPTRRVKDRAITTPAGLPDGGAWAEAICRTGGSQCGFCTPGIIVRLSGLKAKKPDADRGDIDNALAAHLCRCTGWNTIAEAWDQFGADVTGAIAAERDWDAASQRAAIEGRTPQRISPEVAAGAAVFAADTAPADALVALRRGDGEWVVGKNLTEARQLAGKVQGRRTTLEPHYPIEIPAGDWAATLQTTWAEPAYLETDAAWCEPGGEPASPLANGGAFGAKLDTGVGEVARALADEHGHTVLALFSREDATILGPKRPPIAAGVRSDGTGELVVARTAGIAEAISRVAPDLTVTEVDIAGPSTSSVLRAAGWAEAIALLAAAKGEVGRVETPEGGWAEVTMTDETIDVTVNAGPVLDATMLRSYCIGAAHMALSWVRTEALAVDEAGTIHDLTVRSFGVLRSMDMPQINVLIIEQAGDGEEGGGGVHEPVNASDAVFAAVAAAAWLHAGTPHRWPVQP